MYKSKNIFKHDIISTYNNPIIINNHSFLNLKINNKQYINFNNNIYSIEKISNYKYNIITYDSSGNNDGNKIYSNNSNIQIKKDYIYTLTFSIETLNIRIINTLYERPTYLKYQDGSGTVKIIGVENGTFKCVDKDNKLITNTNNTILCERIDLSGDITVNGSYSSWNDSFKPYTISLSDKILFDGKNNTHKIRKLFLVGKD